MTELDPVGVKKDLSKEKNGGVIIETIRPGDGDDCPEFGDRVTVHYVGTLEDGTVFDSSRERKETSDFTVGKGEIIKGLDTALTHMRKNELARITCKPEYAYGNSGMPPKIPPDATLIFEVELIKWKALDLTKAQDGGIIKRITKEGTGYSTPNHGALVTIRYSGHHEEREFENREVTFTQGEGEEEGIIPGLEIATQKMKHGEHNQLTISAKYAYGEKGCSEFSIPPGAKLVYDVQMINFEKAKESWDMDVGQKIEQSKVIKEKGTKYFKKGNYQKALEYYQKIVSYLEHETSGMVEGESEQREQLLLAAYLNISICSLKLQNFCNAEDASNKALEIDKDNIKALFRRGQSRLERCEYATAAVDFEKILELEPNNSAAKNQLTVCRKKEKAAYAKEKELYVSMFQKMAQKSGGGFNLYQTMPEVGEWNNDMAKDMMPLQDERDAFEDGTDMEKKDLSPRLGGGDMED